MYENFFLYFAQRPDQLTAIARTLVNVSALCLLLGVIGRLAKVAIGKLPLV
jgi:hypothetical protein